MLLFIRYYPLFRNITIFNVILLKKANDIFFTLNHQTMKCISFYIHPVSGFIENACVFCVFLGALRITLVDR